MIHIREEQHYKKSILRALFVPLFFIMLFQAVVFYMVAVYGGIEETMDQNAADILSERLVNRKNEIQNMFTKNWTNFDTGEKALDTLYEQYTQRYGDKPLASKEECQLSYLKKSSSILVDILRNNQVNGVYLILNNQVRQNTETYADTEEKVGINLRDLDQNSEYLGTEDLLLERCPSSLIKSIKCSLDSWWEARYTFHSRDEGDFYYEPLDAAWNNPDVAGEDLAFFAGAHQISGSDEKVVSYSIPLMDKNSYPYAVLGVELTTAYLDSLLPSEELDNSNKSCYVLALEEEESASCQTITGSGTMYNRCFDEQAVIDCSTTNATGGFDVIGRGDIKLYGDKENLVIYNNNNPFDSEHLTLMALIDEKELFIYMERIKNTLAMVSVFCMMLGLCSLFLVSRRFSRPITSLAQKVQHMSPKKGYQLDRLGIREIDQLVDAIEVLNQNASRDIARTEFFSRMSHDMRTPMNAIISFSSPELLEGTDEQKKIEYLEKIHSSGEYLLGLINEVMDMTKIESNKIDMQYTPMNTSHLWVTLIPIIEKLAQKKSVNFIQDIHMEEAMVMVDEQHLNQVVMNLLSNAVKFTPEQGTIRLSVQIIPHKTDPELLDCSIVVADSGIGMSKEFMRHLYEPFKQENEGKEGTGLGLSIAKKLVEMMGGTIHCVSQRNMGTTFTLHIQLSRCSQEEVASYQQEVSKEKKEAVWAEKSSVLRGKRMLVCEDHPLNMQIIKRLLERVEIQVETAENGQIGVDMFQQKSEGYYDAVLLDIRMPVMDGLETARTIRSIDREDAKEVPIIAMTANAFSEDVAASKAAGMDAHLSKPVDPQILYETLYKFLLKKEPNMDK